MSDYNLQVCQRRGGIFRRMNPHSGKAEFKAVRFHCGKRTCPICQERRKKVLILRLKNVNWNKRMYLWTITTDPKILTKEEALVTINRRWHVVHRSLLRLSPKLRYFRVVEFTRSGLPHLHIITDQYIEWSGFQQLLQNQLFGEVLHFTPIPIGAGIKYLTKYCSKAVYGQNRPYNFTGRLWAASFGLLPPVTYFQGPNQWELVHFVNRIGEIEFWLHAHELHEIDRPPPFAP